MRLLLTDDVTREVSFDAVTMTSTEFNTVSSHPYIVSHRFDTVVVDLNLKVSLKYLRLLIGITRVIPRVVGELTADSVGILSEIYPDKAAELRVLFMRDKDSFDKLINDLAEQFHWDEFY